MKKTPLDYALNLLKIRDRSEGEVRQKMKLKGFFVEEVDGVIKKLKETRLLDDARFVESYVRSQQNMGRGIARIKFRLKCLKIDDELIKSHMSEISSEDEGQRADELACHWLQKKKVAPEKRYEKLGRFLVTRGFEIGTVRKILDKYCHPGQNLE